MSGNKMPDPAACKKRLGSKTVNDGATRHRTSPATMHPHAKNSSLRVEKRPDRKAMMAVKIDVTIMYPETSHCAVVALTEKAAMISCSATLMMFSLNAATKAAIYITTRNAEVADGVA